MGLDTKLYINQSWSVEDIKDVIEKRFKIAVVLKFHDWAPDYLQMIITYQNVRRWLPSSYVKPASQ